MNREEKAYSLLLKLKEINELYKELDCDEEMIVSFGKEHIEFINPKVIKCN